MSGLLSMIGMQAELDYLIGDFPACFELFYENEKDGWDIDMLGEPLKHEIHYVHELQHIFFGLGIKHEMEA